MELKEFVSEAICQVMEGVKLAQEKTKDTGAIINPLGYFIREDSRGGQVRHTFHFSERIIEFDVAINAIDSESTKGGVGVFFWSRRNWSSRTIKYRELCRKQD